MNGTSSGGGTGEGFIHDRATSRGERGARRGEEGSGLTLAGDGGDAASVAHGKGEKYGFCRSQIGNRDLIDGVRRGESTRGRNAVILR